MLKVFEINVFFHSPTSLKECVLYTLFNIDNYGRPLIKYVKKDNQLLKHFLVEFC